VPSTTTTSPQPCVRQPNGRGRGHEEHGNGKGLGHLKHGDDCAQTAATCAQDQGAAQTRFARFRQLFAPVRTLIGGAQRQGGHDCDSQASKVGGTVAQPRRYDTKITAYRGNPKR
jgi:hypothetical protein